MWLLLKSASLVEGRQSTQSSGMTKKASLQVTSFGGSISPSPSSSSMCFASPKNNKKDPESGLCACYRAPRSHCISAICVIILMFVYTSIGSILFVTLEGDNDENLSTHETAVAASKPFPRTDDDRVTNEIRARTVERLWSITEDLNILYKDNWTRLAAQEVLLFQDTLRRELNSKNQELGYLQYNKPHKWSYASAVLYSLTLITTIGYGGITPRTQWGRVAALIYAIFGIPIVLLYLSAMGEGLAAIIRFIFRQFRSKSSSSASSSSSSSSKTPTDVASTSNQQPQNTVHSNSYQISTPPDIPISICALVLIVYISLGAVLFYKVQGWSVLESVYFCFTSLSTIGFGDLTPTGNLCQYLASGYILIGMAVVAMCFNLIQTELIVLLRKCGFLDPLSCCESPDDTALVPVPLTPKS